jgi:hypothetical protein
MHDCIHHYAHHDAPDYDADALHLGFILLSMVAKLIKKYRFAPFLQVYCAYSAQKYR